MEVGEWMKQHGKAPWRVPGSDRPFYYWGTMADFDPHDPESVEEQDFLLPEPVFARLRARTAYPNVKVYWSQLAAIEDLAQAIEE